jgi:membrane-associated phospholipid phosphatase
MKQFFFALVLLFIVWDGNAQNLTPVSYASYEAAGWKTWLLDDHQAIVIAAPPTAAQAKAEIKLLKEAMNTLDESKLQQIRYWDAGAPAYRWNQITSQLLASRFDLLLRIPGSWINIAIYDATILAWQEKIKYKRGRPQTADASVRPVIAAPPTYSYPCEHTVTAAAAANVLAYFFPEKADSILQLARAASQSRINAGVQFPSDAEAGWKLGEAVAKQIIEKAKNDGSARVWDGKMNKDPKKWTGTYPLGITMASFTPIVMRSPDQFRVPPPPDFEAEMKEMKKFKQTFRTSAQAYYWASSSDTWTDLASQKIFEYHLDDNAPAAARIYTVLSTASHEMAIAIMDSKYAYWGIRPNQYDTTYKSLIPTPPFPGYPSGHAAGAGTACAVMEYFFPADAKQFQKLAQDCADSRFYAGIHFKVDNEAGLKMGKELGKWVVETWMKETKTVRK